MQWLFGFGWCELMERRLFVYYKHERVGAKFAIFPPPSKVHKKKENFFLIKKRNY